MSWLTDTIAGRTIMVLVLGLGTILALAQYFYQSGIEREITASNTESVVDRLLLMADSIASVDVAKRDDAAHRLSGGPLELHWSRDALAIAGGRLDEVALRLRDRLIAKSPGLAQNGLIIGSSRSEVSEHTPGRSPDDGHTTLVSLPLKDGSWLNISLANVSTARTLPPSALLSTVLGAFGVVLLSILMGRWLTQPLERLAAGARGLFLTSQTVRLPQTGTREVRTLASAINDLQHRIRRMVDDRTQMLAAISHDLRSPLTRLRLRLEGLSDASVRKSMAADLDEMEAMIDATLAFLRDDTANEPVEKVDIAAILQTIAADASDAGLKVDVESPRSLVLAGRHLALKRALTNLVQNAAKYGGSAAITAYNDGSSIRITVTDDGPGIPADKLEAVFEPFYRIETSRTRGSSGGHGLGLTVARSIVRAHGGDVHLDNRSPHGLQARVTLPVAPGTITAT